MSSLESPLQEKYILKKKICVLGGQEKYKDAFQKELSTNSLSIENKRNIGVNISKIDYFFRENEKFEFLLWNIDCRRSRSYLRTIFYNGAEAIIIFISETKMDQILRYFDEIQDRLSSITVVFCIILEQYTKDEIVHNYFRIEEYKSIFKAHNIQIAEIFESSEVLNQICSISFKRREFKELENFYFLNFIPLDLLFPHSDIKDECNDYYEPETRNMNINRTINTDQLVTYILKLNLDCNLESDNWLKFVNKKLGKFSISLKNGNVYYYPKVCENCKDIRCMKFKKAPFFICIEAGNSTGWSNIEGFEQNEILVLTKILTLIEANENNLPRSVLKQIIRTNICEKGIK